MVTAHHLCFNDRNKKWCKVINVINNRYLNIVGVIYEEKLYQTIVSLTVYPCERILISPDVMIIAQCGKHACTWCGARSCLVF